MTNEPVTGEQIGQADIEDTAAASPENLTPNEESAPAPSEDAAAPEEPAAEAPSDAETPSDYRVSGEHGPAAA